MRRGNERQKFIDDTARAIYALQAQTWKVVGGAPVTSSRMIYAAEAYHDAAALWDAREGFRDMERIRAAAAKRRAAEEKT